MLAKGELPKYACHVQENLPVLFSRVSWRADCFVLCFDFNLFLDTSFMSLKLLLFANHIEFVELKKGINFQINT